MIRKFILSTLLFGTVSAISAGNIFVSFARGWDESQWLPVRSPRWTITAKWKQEADCISNVIGGDPGSEHKKNARGSDYVSMLYKKPLSGNKRIETVCLFKERMAPLLVISPEIGPVYGEHIEIVAFDQGVNVWYHYLKPNGKPAWKLIGFLGKKLEPGKKHKLVTEMRFSRRGPYVCVGIDDTELGIMLPKNWKDKYYAGITACEGHNSFYSFRITEIKKSGPVHSRIPR